MLSYWLQFWWMSPIALSICVTANTLGVSGAALFLPFYTLIFPLLGHHLEPVQAVEVGILTEIFGFMSSTTAFWRARLIDFRIAGYAVMFAAPMAVLGGYASHFLPAQLMLAIIGLGLLALSWLLLRKGPAVHSPGEDSRAAQLKVLTGSGVKEHVDREGRVYRYRVLNDLWRGLAASIGGVFHGLVGFSAGELSTVEQVFRGMPVRVASGNSHLIIASASIAAAFTHLGVSAVRGSQVPWNILAITIPTVLVGGQLAALVAGRMPQQKLRVVLSGLLLFLGAISLYRVFAASHAPLVGGATAVLALGGAFLVLRRSGSSASEECQELG
jgi:uncharacterized membrane protein YfcA